MPVKPPVPLHANGRPYGIVAERIDALEQAVAAGHFFATACELTGVNPHVFRDWLEKGEADGAVEPYASFALRLRVAEAAGQDRALRAINGAFDRDWKAAAWFLSRKSPAQWAEQRQGLQVATTGNVTFFLPDNGRDEPAAETPSGE